MGSKKGLAGGAVAAAVIGGVAPATALAYDTLPRSTPITGLRAGCSGTAELIRGGFASDGSVGVYGHAQVVCNPPTAFDDNTSVTISLNGPNGQASNGVNPYTQDYYQFPYYKWVWGNKTAPLINYRGTYSMIVNVNGGAAQASGGALLTANLDGIVLPSTDPCANS